MFLAMKTIGMFFRQDDTNFVDGFMYKILGFITLFRFDAFIWNLEEKETSAWLCVTMLSRKDAHSWVVLNASYVSDFSIVDLNFWLSVETVVSLEIFEKTINMKTN